MPVKVLSEGERFYGAAFQFQRDSLMETLRKELMGEVILSYEDSEMDKRLRDTLLLVRDTPADFVYLDAEEVEMLGIDRHFKKIGDIKKMLKGRKNGSSNEGRL